MRLESRRCHSRRFLGPRHQCGIRAHIELAPGSSQGSAKPPAPRRQRAGQRRPAAQLPETGRPAVPLARVRCHCSMRSSHSARQGRAWYARQRQHLDQLRLLLRLLLALLLALALALAAMPRRYAPRRLLMPRQQEDFDAAVAHRP